MASAERSAPWRISTIKRRIFVHINNSNPALRRDSIERAQVEAAGWEIGHDGLLIDMLSIDSA